MVEVPDEDPEQQPTKPGTQIMRHCSTGSRCSALDKAIFSQYEVLKPFRTSSSLLKDGSIPGPSPRTMFIA